MKLYRKKRKPGKLPFLWTLATKSYLPLGVDSLPFQGGLVSPPSPPVILFCVSSESKVSLAYLILVFDDAFFIVRKS